MLHDEEKLKLLDLIDRNFLQEFQDNFAKAMNIASIIYDTEGPVTEPSRFTDFCKNTRGSIPGAKMCQECDLKWGKIAAESGKPVIYSCHTGLVDFVVPIMVEGRHLGSFFGGQIFFDHPNENNIRKIAKELGVNEDEYIELVEKVDIVPEGNIKAAVNLLCIVTSTISEIAHKNLELIKKNKRENLLRTITDKIRSSIDLDETLTFICEETMKLFNVQRASMSELLYFNYDKKQIFRKECKSNPILESLDKLKHFDQITKYYIQQLFQNTKIISIDNILESDTPDYFKESYNILGVKSLLVIPIQNNDDKWGALILSEYTHYRHWTKDEIELAQSIAAQIYIAIKHAELYKKEKETARREILLREITEIIRSSLDFKDVQYEIVNQVGRLMKADRVHIGYYDYKSQNFTVPKEAEYKPSHTLKSMVGVDFKNIPYFVEYLLNRHLQGEDIIYNNLENYLDENNLRGHGIEQFYREYGFISSAVINIYNEGLFLGNLVITFEHPRDFSDDEIKFLKTLVVQAGNALHQSMLHEKVCKQAKQEKFSRKIIEMLRNSVEQNTIKNLLVTNIGEYFSANRVFFADFDTSSNSYLPVKKKSEFLSSLKEKSFVGFDWTHEQMNEYIQPLIEKKELHIFCWHEYIQKNKKNNGFISRFEGANVKSSYNFPVLYQKKIMGFLCIEFTKDVCIILSDEDISSVRDICTQAGRALYHSEWYTRAKNSLEQIGNL